jgi:hypothetical protein
LNPIQAHYQAVLRPDKKRKMSPRQGIFKQENVGFLFLIAGLLYSATDRRLGGLQCLLEQHLPGKSSRDVLAKKTIA